MPSEENRSLYLNRLVIVASSSLFYCICLSEESFILISNNKSVDVIIEQRFYQTSDGKYWTENAFAYAFWTRYLTVFSTVNIVARVKQVSTNQAQWHRVDGEGVMFYPLPYYLGLKAFIYALPKLLSTLYQRRRHQGNVIFRIPGVLALLYRIFAMPVSKAYGAEVVGDPDDTFAKNASTSLMRPIIRQTFIQMLKWQCRRASAISYVTEHTLQQKYPPNEHAFSTYYSSIQLSAQDFKQRQGYSLNKPLKLIAIGNLAQPYKGCDFMLTALAQLHRQGINAQLTWVGGGQLLAEMQQLASTLKIAHAVNFVGNVSERASINALLDDADIFILSSRQEGLPRVLIEAMARSLVCIATNVGGVCELLNPQYIIERDNVNQLVEKITALIAMNEQQLMALSHINYQKARQYDDKVLSFRRQEMYQALLKAAQ